MSARIDEPAAVPLLTRQEGDLTACHEHSGIDVSARIDEPAAVPLLTRQEGDLSLIHI